MNTPDTSEMTETPVSWTTFDNRTAADPEATRSGDLQVIGYDNRDFGDMWFAVAQSSDITATEIAQLSFFETPLIGFRDEDGVARVASGVCPHLGVALHLGDMCEGKVRCGMHHWSFDPSDGKVSDIPYSESRPNISMTMYPTVEQAGFVFVWWPKVHQTPQWELPDLLAFGGAVFPTPAMDFVDFNACLPDTMENVADYRHFGVVHDQFSDLGRPVIDHPEPHIARFQIEGNVAGDEPDEIGSGLAGSDAAANDFTFEINAYGLGVSRSIVGLGGGLILNLSFRTPLSRRRVRDWLLSAAITEDGAPADESLVTSVQDYALKTVAEDIPFWETKSYPTARLVREDGPIMAYRRWSRQFHHPEVRSQTRHACG